MIEAIGDLSKADKGFLMVMAMHHNRILEGGVGASTQILTHYTAGTVVSYDTSQEWIDHIRDTVFPQVGVEGSCEFRIYNPRQKELEGRYDFVFVDLEWKHRFLFAKKAWRLLVPGGKLVFHDARRNKDMSNVSDFMLDRYREIASVEICPLDSNMGVFTKRDKRCDYVNWHITEEMTPEQLGIAWLEK